MGLFAKSQQAVNYDETKVGTYYLPALLTTTKGQKITTRRQWEKERRPEILALFTEFVYGRIPKNFPATRYHTVTNDTTALQGKATRKEVTIYFGKENDAPSLHLLLYLPNSVPKKAPVFVGLNFQGNHTVHKDSAISITANWKKRNANNQAIERGGQERRWPVEALIDVGYGLATAWYEDLEPDNASGWQSGIRTSLQTELGIQPLEWGAIGVWAWGLSRIMDYLEKDERVNAAQVVLTGHSRLGKAALWAAANDQRFAMIVANNSGEGGAALARRNYGETVARINTSFPHWFVSKYKTFNEAVDQLPVDQHMLLALMAPRPLYVASAANDKWADPKGEFLSAKHAGEAYALYGLKGIEEDSLPPLHQPVGNAIRYHIREGDHDIVLYDWQQYIAFADAYFRKNKM
ncbi:acetylxylan esterase [Flavisolibacter sp. BT320]|nr:acetylxylan esterase [Flavisolibacter longurius]